MSSVQESLSARVRAAFAALGLPEERGDVQPSTRAGSAPYQCNGAMAAAKQAGRPPRDVAADVVAKLEGDDSFAALEIAGPGFINITPSEALIADRARDMAADERAGAEADSHPLKVVIDFGGPNVAKPMHVGHLRSSVIGDCLQRLLRFRGHDVTSDIHLGDWGLQMGHLITELYDEQPDLVYFDEAYEGEYPSEPPVDIDDLSRMYPLASSKAKDDEARMARSRQATAELQAGRLGYRALLQHFIDVSIAALKKDFGRLGVHFDLWKGEAAVDPLIPGMVEGLKAQGVTEEDEGALIIRVSEEEDKKKVPPLILISSAGAALYATTDLATLVDRKDNIDPDKVLYVVDQRQAQHFEQVFRAAAKAGWYGLEDLEHLGFGTVNGPDGKPFKTREGGVLRLADLMDMATAAAKERLAEAGLGKEMSESQVQDIAEKVGLGAIKYADLQNQRTTNYIFDLDRFTAFEGKTGPYHLYAAVRMKALLRRASEEGAAPGDIQPDHASEVGLVLALDDFDRSLKSAEDKRAPHILCDHTFALAQAFSKFYSDCPIFAGGVDKDVQASRLGLVALTLKQLELALGLLGIETPERM